VFTDTAFVSVGYYPIGKDEVLNAEVWVSKNTKLPIPL
jgi:hypothetical protein